MNIIFLDFDGVIGTKRAESITNGWWDSACVTQLQRILEVTEAKIVITSTHRLRPQNHAKKVLHQLGIDVRKHVVGQTPHLGGKAKRHEEIQAWLTDNKEFHGEPKFVIIDDMGEDEIGPFMANLCQTTLELGLTLEIAEKVIAAFKKKN